MEVPRHWRLKEQRYSLVGEICPHCEAKIFPPRDICPECGRGTLNGNLGVQVEIKTAIVGFEGLRTRNTVAED